MQAIRTLFAVAAITLLALFSGCASGGASAAKTGESPVQVRFTDYKSGRTMGIVNDAWLRAEGFAGENPSERRAKFYSRTTDMQQAGLKVATDEEMLAILDVFDEYGFSEYGQDGTPPPDLSQAMEVQKNGADRYVYGRRGMDLDQGNAFRYTVNAFVDIYNALEQNQAVEGGVQFSQPDLRR